VIWSFIVDITGVSNAMISKIVEKEAKAIASLIGKPKEPAIFRVIITFYQKLDRWLRENQMIPREDIGRDLDNLIKPVFDGLGPIIGYRKRWQGGTVSSTYASRDSRIVEVIAKKVNSGSNKEFLSIQVENIIL